MDAWGQRMCESREEVGGKFLVLGYFRYFRPLWLVRVYSYFTLCLSSSKLSFFELLFVLYFFGRLKSPGSPHLNIF